MKRFKNRRLTCKLILFFLLSVILVLGSVVIGYGFLHRNLAWWVVYPGVAGLLFLFLKVIFVGRSIVRPFQVMAEAIEEIATGNLDFRIPRMTAQDEAGKLAQALTYLKASLKHYHQMLKETSASQEHLESELKVAHDIQMSLLPKVFPPFPQCPEFDLFALMETAKEVGGDFYDFFPVDQRHLFFVMGDVSGKGIPAALFMAVTKTLIKAKATLGGSPREVLAEVNRELFRRNDFSMFATIFCGILNRESGEINYANGGHNPPLLLRRGKEPGFLKKPGEMVLGVFKNIVYSKGSLRLEPGDALFLYTDGLTEAMNSQEELFSEKRLMELLAGADQKSVKETIFFLREEILAFLHPLPLPDDLTMMMLKYNGRS
jgi:sigma-B regulation protein RsbU (phosphoserine phosphatase)